jgi:hypothetical protein
MTQANARDICIRDDGYATNIVRSQTPFSAVVGLTQRRSGGWLLATRCVQCLGASAIRCTAAVRVFCRTPAPFPIVLGPSGD